MASKVRLNKLARTLNVSLGQLSDVFNTSSVSLNDEVVLLEEGDVVTNLSNMNVIELENLMQDLENEIDLKMLVAKFIEVANRLNSLGIDYNTINPYASSGIE